MFSKSEAEKNPLNLNIRLFYYLFCINFFYMCLGFTYFCPRT